ncbi:unnamed protein product, partial [Closterium sp. NIES-54]
MGRDGQAGRTGRVRRDGTGRATQTGRTAQRGGTEGTAGGDASGQQGRRDGTGQPGRRDGRGDGTGQQGQRDRTGQQGRLDGRRDGTGQQGRRDGRGDGTGQQGRRDSRGDGTGRDNRGYTTVGAAGARARETRAIGAKGQVVSFSRAIAVSPLPFATSLRVTSRVFSMAAASKTKIYGLKLSTCTKRVLTALEEKNVTDYEFVTIDLSKGEQKSAEFKKKQPFGVIPVLEDEEVELFESRAIARYVADKYAEQGTNLLGSTLKERALVNLWLEVESQNYNPPISGLIAEKIFKPRKGLATDEVKAAEYKAK